MRRRFVLSAAVRGYSLIELAIVLAILGVVLAAIWSARSVVVQRQHVDNAVLSVRETAENVRALYTGQQNTAYLTGQAQVCANLFPRSFLLGTGTYDCNTWMPRHPWQGEVRLGFSPAAARPRGVSIALLGTNPTLPTPVCVDMLDRMQGVDHRIGGGGGVSTTNGVPFPTSLPPYETVQGGQPTNVYVSPSLGTWLEATGKEPTWILQQVGSRDCYGIAFFFEF